MGTTNKLYASREGTLTIAALPMEEGLVPDGFLKFAPPEAFGHVYGVRGDVSRYRKSDPVVPVDLTIWSTSRHNQELAAIHAADTIDNKGAGVGVFLWKDNMGATIVMSDMCWIIQAPEWEVGEEIKPCTWKLAIVAPPEARIFGGN
jgi:hypothetical protein